MAKLGGLCTSLLSLTAAVWLGALATGNLPRSRAPLALVILGVIAVLIGYVAGSAVCRIAARRKESLSTFGAVAGTVAGGVMGAASALTLTAFYLSSYTQWPADRTQEALLVLAYPAFALLGFCVGAIPGLLVGIVGGSVLRLATHRR